MNLKDKDAHVYTVKLTNTTNKPLLSSLYCLCPSQEQRLFNRSMEDVFLYNRILAPKAQAATDKPSPIKELPTPETPGKASVGDPTFPLGMAY